MSMCVWDPLFVDQAEACSKIAGMQARSLAYQLCNQTRCMNVKGKPIWGLQQYIETGDGRSRAYGWHLNHSFYAAILRYSSAGPTGGSQDVHAVL